MNTADDSPRKNSKAEKEKRVARNQRILTEFPWLWAVRKNWFLGDDEIHISNLNDSFTTFLKSEASSQAEEGRHVWIYFQHNDHCHAVEEIFGKYWHGKEWKHALHGRLLPYIKSVKLIAIAICDNSCGIQILNTKVYRLKKPLTREKFAELYL